MIYRLSSFKELLSQQLKKRGMVSKIALETMKLNHLREIGFVFHVLLFPAINAQFRPILHNPRLSPHSQLIYFMKTLLSAIFKRRRLCSARPLPVRVRSARSRRSPCFNLPDRRNW
jgi:hypothetical protein